MQEAIWLLARALDALGVVWLSPRGVEADDVIAALAARGAALGMQVRPPGTRLARRPAWRPRMQLPLRLRMWLPLHPQRCPLAPSPPPPLPPPRTRSPRRCPHMLPTPHPHSPHAHKHTPSTQPTPRRR